MAISRHGLMWGWRHVGTMCWAALQCLLDLHRNNGDLG